MIDERDSSTWRVRDAEGVVHWLDVPAEHALAKARCKRAHFRMDGWFVARWGPQHYVDDAVSCMICLAAGPEPPPQPDIAWPWSED